MNYEGIKRQKAVGQLMFETIPQLTVNIVIVFVIFNSDNNRFSKDITITINDIILSIISALLNSTFQLLRIYFESKVCEETLTSYLMHCLMARIDFIPFKTK